MLKVLLVEDQALVRGAISALLTLSGNIEVTAEAENGKNAIALLAKHSVDIILTDIEMPEMTGIELVEQVAVSHPEIKTMIMTTFSRAGYIKRALTAGVKGFILKESPSQYLIEAVKKVAQGQKVIETELALLALDNLDPLTNKERQALRLASEGMKTADIAAALFLSQGTVRNYLSEAMAKLNAVNRIDAARIAKQKGWL
jgi:two-component system response regulator DesR